MKKKKYIIDPVDSDTIMKNHKLSKEEAIKLLNFDSAHNNEVEITKHTIEKMIVQKIYTTVEDTRDSEG